MSENRNNNKYISWPVNELDVVNVPENTRIASSASTCSLARGGAGLDTELVCKVSTIVSSYQNLQQSFGEVSQSRRRPLLILRFYIDFR